MLFYGCIDYFIKLLLYITEWIIIVCHQASEIKHLFFCCIFCNIGFGDDWILYGNNPKYVHIMIQFLVMYLKLECVFVHSRKIKKKAKKFKNKVELYACLWSKLCLMWIINILNMLAYIDHSDNKTFLVFVVFLWNVASTK